MAISLVKGQKIDLTKKDGGSLKDITVGLGWDPIEPEKKGLFGGLFGGGSVEIDCDASVLMLSENDKLVQKNDLIYYGNLKSSCGSVLHTGDNRTGEGEGDDEAINIDLSKVPSRISKLLFVVNIYDCVNKKQHFGMIQNAFIRVVDKTSRTEICKYNLTDDYSGKTSLVTGEIYRHNGGWKFNAIGTGTNAKSLQEIIRDYK